MKPVEQYAKRLRDAQVDVARKLGMDIVYADKESRVMTLSSLAVHAVLVKLLVDKGVLTDAELAAALTVVRSSGYAPAPVPVEPELWDMMPATGV